MFMLEQVGAAPKVSLSPKQIDFVTGGVTRIECSATGSPPAAISWRHRGRTLAAGSRVGKCLVVAGKHFRCDNTVCQLVFLVCILSI